MLHTDASHYSSSDSVLVSCNGAGGVEYTKEVELEVSSSDSHVKVPLNNG